MATSLRGRYLKNCANTTTTICLTGHHKALREIYLFIFCNLVKQLIKLPTALNPMIQLLHKFRTSTDIRWALRIKFFQWQEGCLRSCFRFYFQKAHSRGVTVRLRGSPMSVQFKRGGGIDFSLRKYWLHSEVIKAAERESCYLAAASARTVKCLIRSCRIYNYFPSHLLFQAKSSLTAPFEVLGATANIYRLCLLIVQYALTLTASALLNMFE